MAAKQLKNYDSVQPFYLKLNPKSSADSLTCFVWKHFPRVHLHRNNRYTKAWVYITSVNYKMILHYRCHNQIYLLEGFYCEAAAKVCYTIYLIHTVLFPYR